MFFDVTPLSRSNIQYRWAASHYEYCVAFLEFSGFFQAYDPVLKMLVLEPAGNLFWVGNVAVSIILYKGVKLAVG